MDYIIAVFVWAPPAGADRLAASGELVWAVDPVESSSDDGVRPLSRLRFFERGTGALWIAEHDHEMSDDAAAVRDAIAREGASFLADLQAATGFTMFRVRDALRNVPGVTIGVGEGGAQGDTFILRGFSARGDLYMDGMRDLPSFNRDSFNLEAIEVFEGPSSTLFGRGSTGGGINQVSKLPQPKSFYELEGGIGNADYYRGTGDFNHVFNDSIAVRVPVMAETSGVAERNVTEQNRWGVAPSFTIGMNSPTKFTLNYLHLQDDNIPDFGIPVYFGKPAPVNRSNFYGYRDFDYEKDWADVLTGQIKHEWNSSLSATQSLRYARVSREQSPTSPRIPGATLESTIDGLGPDGIASVHNSHSNGSLVFGADGTLWIATGDGAHYDYTDAGDHDADADRGDEQTPPDIACLDLQPKERDSEPNRDRDR